MLKLHTPSRCACRHARIAFRAVVREQINSWNFDDITKLQCEVFILEQTLPSLCCHDYNAQ